MRKRCATPCGVTDLAARYGGEEFCIVMPGANPEERAHGGPTGLPRGRLRQPHALADNGILTAGVGVFSADPAGVAGPDQLTGFADDALQQAKRTGRNRVVGR